MTALNVKDRINKDNERQYMLALDGDIDFHPDAIMSVLSLMKSDSGLGSVCGRIAPMGKGLVYYYQMWEYGTGHWLLKSTEDILGTVLCSPGCFALFRAEAFLKDVNGKEDSLITKYDQHSNDPYKYIQWNMGEDRWMCTMMIQRGWRIKFTALSYSLTNAPTSIGEFFKQRRRWGPSTLFNIYDLIQTGNEVRKINSHVTWYYMLYHILLAASGFLSPAVVTLGIQGGLAFVFGIDQTVSLFLALAPLVFYVYICLTKQDAVQLKWAQILTVVYSILTICVYVSVIVSLFQAGIGHCSLVNQVFIMIVLTQVTAALLHFQEAHPFTGTFWSILPYLVLVPAMFVCLNVYMYCNLHVTSWGTRESGKNKDKEAESNKYGKLQGFFSHRLRNAISFGNIFSVQCCPEPEDRESLDKIEAKVVEFKKRVNAKIENNKNGLNDMNKVQKNVKPLKFGFYKYDFSNLTRIEKDGKRKDCERSKITPDAHEFFSWLVQDKLSPRHDSDAVQKQRHEDLLALRNDFVFIYFLLNLAWLLVIFVVQLVLADNDAYLTFGYSVPLPGCEDLSAAALSSALDDNKFKQYFQFNPINLCFMLFYVVVMLIQFGCMIVHRWLSFLQIMSSLDLKRPFHGKIFNFLKKDENPST